MRKSFEGQVLRAFGDSEIEGKPFANEPVVDQFHSMAALVDNELAVFGELDLVLLELLELLLLGFGQLCFLGRLSEVHFVLFGGGVRSAWVGSLF